MCDADTTELLKNNKFMVKNIFFMGVPSSDNELWDIRCADFVQDIILKKLTSRQ